MFLSSALALALTAVPLTPAAAAAQGDPWTPWYGCWRAEGAPAGEAVCIVPDNWGARMVTLDQGAVRSDARVATDGAPHRSERDGCSTLESARWSADRQRVFLASELTCDGQVVRRSRGLIAFTSARQWLSVQTIAGEEGTAVRAVRFSPARNVRLPATLERSLPRLVAIDARVERIDEGDVVEATDHLDPESVQEWLRAANAPFQLSDYSSGSGSSSALDDLADISRSVDDRRITVVHVIEPRSCIYGGCSWLRTYSCWSPWGYDRFAWRVAPHVAYWRRPVLLHVGVSIGLGHGIRIAHYDNYWHRRNDWWRYDSHDRWPGFGDATRSRGVGYGVSRSSGSVGPGGYTAPRSGGGAVGRGIGSSAARGDDRSYSERGGGIDRRREPSTAGENRGIGVVRSEPQRQDVGRPVAVERREVPRASPERGSSSDRGSVTRSSPDRGRSEPARIGSGRGSSGSVREPSRSTPSRGSSGSVSARGGYSGSGSGSAGGRAVAKPRQ